VPGRGDALIGRENCRIAIQQTREFVSELLSSVKTGRQAGRSLRDIYRSTCDGLRPKFG
jgi:hypothetical protein